MIDRSIEDNEGLVSQDSLPHLPCWDGISQRVGRESTLNIPILVDSDHLSVPLRGLKTADGCSTIPSKVVMAGVKSSSMRIPET